MSYRGMSAVEVGERLTFAQRRALGDLSRATTRRSAKSLGQRSDVLWRLEEGGLVSRSIGDEWSITPKGQEAYDAWWAKRASDGYGSKS